MIDSKRQWALLEEIGYTRISGSPQERQAANSLKQAVEKAGGKAVIEEFEVDWQDVTVSELTTDKKSYEVSTFYQCANTPEEGITAEFYYLNSDNAVGLQNCKDKIVMVNGLGVKMFEKLIKAGAKGFITFNGQLNDKNDLSHRELRGILREKGNIPGVNMKIEDAMALVLENPEKVTIKTKQDTYKINSCNVISDIKGEKYPEEVITLTAHFDSVEYSKGVYDNGAGSVILTELYNYFIENKPDRTLRFIWCGSEERGLLGSKDYVAKHESELEKIIFNINVDVAGPVLGNDIAMVTGPEGLMHYINYLSKEVGFQITVKHDIYSSDCIPFADKGIPAVSFARFGGNGMAYIHDRYDQFFFMDSLNLLKTTEFVKTFTERVVNSYCFPVEREIPEVIVKKVDEYLFKKKEK